MFKKIMILLLVIVMAVTVTACKSKETDTAPKELNQDLIKLLPNEGFQWAYIGPAEYYHEMRLESVTADATQATYKILGEVEDVSEGESQKDYTIELYYQVNSDSIVQIKTEEAMLDSEYDQITLIKTPLEEGTKWSEEVVDSNGKKHTIDSEIIEKSPSESGVVYKVIYKDRKSDYTESRKIMDGFGVIAFSKAVEVDKEVFRYGYGLYGKNSGYIVKEDVPTAEETSDETNDDTTGGDNTDTADTTDDTKDEDTTKDDDTTSKPEEPAINEDVLVKETIELFNDAWIRYVNDNDQSFFNYVTVNGVAYNNAKNFKADGLTEKFLQMNVNQVVVNGNTATAKVYEEIEKTKDGDVSVAKYNWLYDLVKKDGKWLVNGYKKQ